MNKRKKTWINKWIRNFVFVEIFLYKKIHIINNFYNMLVEDCVPNEKFFGNNLKIYSIIRGITLLKPQKKFFNASFLNNEEFFRPYFKTKISVFKTSEIIKRNWSSTDFSKHSGSRFWCGRIAETGLPQWLFAILVQLKTPFACQVGCISSRFA